MNPRGNFTAEPAYYNRFRDHSLKLLVTGIGGIALGLLGYSQIPPYAMQNIGMVLGSGTQWTNELIKAIATGQMPPSLEMVKLICQTPMCWTSGLIGAGILKITEQIGIRKRRAKK